jgi:hypothetical protein
VRLHLVDGTYELFRAHYAPRPGHLAPSGWDAKATVGVASSLLGLLHDTDESSRTWPWHSTTPSALRNDLFPYYKGDEGVLPNCAQFDKSKRRCEQSASPCGR